MMHKMSITQDRHSGAQPSITEIFDHTTINFTVILHETNTFCRKIVFLMTIRLQIYLTNFSLYINPSLSSSHKDS